MRNSITAKMDEITNTIRNEFELNKKEDELVITIPASVYYNSKEVVEIRYPNKDGIVKTLDGDDSEFEYEELYGITKEGYHQYPKYGEFRPYQFDWNMITIDFPVKIKNIKDDINVVYPNIKSYLYL